jgi:hypothetical protein
LSGTAARDSGGSAINDVDATSTAAAAVVPCTSTLSDVHNEALSLGKITWLKKIKELLGERVKSVSIFGPYKKRS